MNCSLLLLSPNCATVLARAYMDSLACVCGCVCVFAKVGGKTPGCSRCHFPNISTNERENIREYSWPVWSVRVFIVRIITVLCSSAARRSKTTNSAVTMLSRLCNIC